MTSYKDNREPGGTGGHLRAVAAARDPQGVTPPYDATTERQALGALMLTRDAVNYAQDHALAAEDFYELGHQAAYRAVMRAIDARLERLDSSAVGGHAEAHGIIEGVSTVNDKGVRVEGRQALAALEAAGMSYGFRDDIDRVLSYAHRRRVQAQALEVAYAAQSGGDYGTVLAQLADLEDTGSTAERFRRAVLEGPAIYDLPPLEPLIEGVFDYDTLAALYGPPGSYKSFVALDMALRVARGEWWAGHEVKDPRTVLYVAAEGLHGMGDRVRGWMLAHDTYGNINDAPPATLKWLGNEPINVMEYDNADALGRTARDLGAGLVVIDTLNRVAPGADENSSKDMGLAIAGLDRVRRLSGACVLVVHHTGKDATKGLRGHSSLLAALDTALEVQGAEGTVNVRATKQKYREGGQLGRWGVKPSGASLALEHGIAAPVAYDWLVEPLRAHDTGDGVTATLLVEATERSRSTVYAALTAAVNAGLVEKPSRTLYRLTTF